MLHIKYLVLLSVLALFALGSCGSSGSSTGMQPITGAFGPGFDVAVMPESFNLGGSAGHVAAAVDPSAAAGADQVVVNITVDGARELKSLYLTLSYDPELYRAVDIQPTTLMGSADELLSLYVPTAQGTLDYGQVLVHPAGLAGLTGSGVIARVTFSREPELVNRVVSNTGPPTRIQSQITDLAYDGSSLTWTYFQQGDYDQNGETNISDLTPIGMHFGEVSPAGSGTPWPLTAVESQVDGDSNGEINIADITAIGANFQQDSLGGYHVYQSDNADDYPSDTPPLGPNGAGTTELTDAPDSPVGVTEAVNYAARGTERIRFAFAIPAAAGDFYWVRPADQDNVLGIASSGIVAVPGPGAPTVSSTTPANQSLSVALNISLTATFSQPMDPATISSSTFTLETGFVPVAGEVTYTGVTAAFNPDFDLLPNTVYRATITTGAQNESGVPLAEDFIWTFETGASADSTAPTVVSTVPADGAVAVPINISPAATFSEGMDPLTLDAATFLLREGTTAVLGVVTIAGETATFSPTADLLPDTLYTATITTGAEDLAGNPLGSDYVWTFQTSSVLDTTRPVVVSTDPEDGDVNIPVNTEAAATFSEAMNVLTITNQTFTLKQGLNPVAGSVNYSGQTAVFTPASELEADTEYTATITTGAEDLAGNSLATDYVWSFTTIFVDLGAISPFGSFGGGSGMTNQGIFTVINGDIGTTGASTMMTGFHDEDGDVYSETPLNVGQVNGQVLTAPPAPGTAEQLVIASQGALDAQAAYDSISPGNLPGGTDPGAGQLGGLVLAPGIYKSAGGTFQITGSDLTLDAQGDPNAVWVFQAASSLTVGDTVPRSVILVNGAQARNVYWYVGSAATINGAGGGTMVGTILASAGITFSTVGNVVVTTLNGRAIGLNASVTLVNVHINIPE